MFGQSRNNVRGDAALPSRQGRAGSTLDDHGLPRRLLAGAAAVERKLCDGEVLCVVSTNALELRHRHRRARTVVRGRLSWSVLATWQPALARGPAQGTNICVKPRRRRCSISSSRARAGYLLGARRWKRRGSTPDNPEIPVQHVKMRRVRAGSSAASGSVCSMRRPRRRWSSSSVTAWCTRTTARSTGRPTRTRPTTCRRGASLGQRRHHRCRARQDARRDRLARRAHDGARAGHLPARWCWQVEKFDYETTRRSSAKG